MDIRRGQQSGPPQEPLRMHLPDQGPTVHIHLPGGKMPPGGRPQDLPKQGKVAIPKNVSDAISFADPEQAKALKEKAESPEQVKENEASEMDKIAIKDAAKKALHQGELQTLTTKRDNLARRMTAAEKLLKNFGEQKAGDSTAGKILRDEFLTIQGDLKKTEDEINIILSGKNRNQVAGAKASAEAEALRAKGAGDKEVRAKTGQALNSFLKVKQEGK